MVCALYDNPNSNLRLYCIRFASSLVILGGGGYKPKTIRALQEDRKLMAENKLMVKLSDEIAKRIKVKDIVFINNSMDFDGDLEFEI